MINKEERGVAKRGASLFWLRVNARTVAGSDAHGALAGELKGQDVSKEPAH